MAIGWEIEIKNILYYHYHYFGFLINVKGITWKKNTNKAKTAQYCHSGK